MVILTKQGSQGSDLNSQRASPPGALGPTQREVPNSPHNVTYGVHSLCSLQASIRVCPGQQPRVQDTRSWSLGRPTQPRVPGIACEQHMELSWPQQAGHSPSNLPGHRHLANYCSNFGTFEGKKKLPRADHMSNPAGGGGQHTIALEYSTIDLASS